MKFREYLIETTEISESIGSYLYLMDMPIGLTESHLQEGLNDFLGKIGLSAHKGKGLINYLADFTKGTGRLVLAAIKGDKDEVQKLISSVTKEEVLDFLLKLDQATLHLVTGPIHFIDAITGWHIGAAIKHSTQKSISVLKQIWEYLKNLKEKIPQIFSMKKQQKILQRISQIENSLPAV